MKSPHELVAILEGIRSWLCKDKSKWKRGDILMNDEHFFRQVDLFFLKLFNIDGEQK